MDADYSVSALIHTMNKDIVEKLRKILELAVRGATQGEMEAAMARAKALAMRYQIDLTTIGPRKEKNPSASLNIDHAHIQSSTRYVRPYHNWVLRTLEEVFDVRFLVWKRCIGSHLHWTQVFCIGEEADIVIATTLFPWLEKLFPALHYKAVKEGKILKNHAHENGYYLGLHNAIKRTSKREEEKLTTNDRNAFALVVYDKKAAIESKLLELAGGKCAKGRSRKSYDATAEAWGLEDGKGINLNQLGQQTPPLSLHQ